MILILKSFSNGDSGVAGLISAVLLFKTNDGVKFCIYWWIEKMLQFYE